MTQSVVVTTPTVDVSVEASKMLKTMLEKEFPVLLYQLRIQTFNFISFKVVEYRKSFPIDEDPSVGTLRHKLNLL